MNGCISANVPLKIPTSAVENWNRVPVAGITGFSSVDYPGKLVAVFFTQGCPWKCGYCHNSHLQPLQSETALSPEVLRAFLQSRQGLLDAIVLSGGEPTLHAHLPALAEFIAGFDYELGLHTNGMNPEGLQLMLPFCSWVGLDVKAPRARYAAVTGSAAFESVEKSAKLLIESGCDYELRMTYHPALLSENDILETAEHFSNMGAKKFILQIFRKQGCEDDRLRGEKNYFPGDLPQPLIEKLKSLFTDWAIRSG